MAAMYRGVIRGLDRFVDKSLPARFQQIWHHAAGPKTIFFWAPTFKWGLVIAGAADLVRPADKLSMKQSSALMATGFIWSRYSTVIIPINWNLFSVNVFLAFVGSNQVYRIYKYQQSVKEAEEAEDAALAAVSEEASISPAGDTAKAA